MADIGTVTVNLSPTIDTGALAASIRSAVADALEQVAGELRAEVAAGPSVPAYPTLPHWKSGAQLTAGDLDLLPIGAIVRDRDGDVATRHPDGEIYPYSPSPTERRRWVRVSGRTGNRQGDFPSSAVADFAPVTLVSLP